MTLLIIGSPRADQFAAAVTAHAPDIDVRIWPDAGRIEDIRYALAWQPQPRPAEDAAQPASSSSPSAPASIILQGPRPAARAARALRRSRPHRPHERVRGAARALSPPPHERVPRAAGAPGVEIPARARRARGARRHHGARRAGRGRGAARSPPSAISCAAGAAAKTLEGVHLLCRPRPARRLPGRHRHPRRAAAAHARHARHPQPRAVRPSCRGWAATSGCRARCSSMPAAAVCRSMPTSSRALDAGELYAASLDVFETEPLPHGQPAVVAPARRRHAAQRRRERARSPSCATRCARSARHIDRRAASRTSSIPSASIRGKHLGGEAPCIIQITVRFRRISGNFPPLPIMAKPCFAWTPKDDGERG